MPKVSKEEIAPCAGTPRQPNCGLRADPAIKGFDDKFRCRRCHRIHIELVYEESGGTNPISGKSRWVKAVVDPRIEAVRQSILGAARDTSQPIGEMPLHLSSREGWNHANKVAKESQRVDAALVAKGASIDERGAEHTKILLKYGVGKQKKGKTK